MRAPGSGRELDNRDGKIDEPILDFVGFGRILGHRSLGARTSRERMRTINEK